MKRIPAHLAALAAAVFATAASADSLASSASSAASNSVGSLSDSIRGSSNSSSGDNKTAEGDYRILDVAQLPDKPGIVRVQLQGATVAAAFALDLPQKTFEAQQLARGDLVGVRHRAYGIEFAHAATRTPFFLVLADDWFGELDPRVVKL